MSRLSEAAIRRLDEARGRATELARELSDPATFEDARRAAELSREHSELSEIAERYDRYTELVARLQQAEDLLRDGADEDMQTLAREELAEVEPQVDDVVGSLQEFLRPRDPNDARDVILEIRGAEGGQEANLWAADLMRMYMKYAEVKNWKVEVLNTSETDLGGIKEVIFELHGRGAYSRLKYEGGGHRVQRVPETEAQGRIHTSSATVSVLPKAEEVDVQIRDDDLRVDVYRSGGHGGQGVNTTDSAVRLTHLPTGLVVTCQDERSQLKNKARAMDVLRSRLFEIELRRQQEEVGSARRSQVGSGERGSKIRTYNFRENRVTDHRIGLTLYNLDRVLEGQLDPLIDALAEADATQLEEAAVILAGQLLREASVRLTASGSPSGRLDAELLLGHVVSATRASVLAHPERDLSADDAAAFERLVARREASEPIAYLLGEREFYGRLFRTDVRALIPRPETELLVELGTAAVARWRAVGIEPRVVDVGTGCGAVAVSVAAECGLRVVGTDVSFEALTLARENALQCAARVVAVQADLLRGLSGPLHVVLANLPYVPNTRVLPRDVAAYEPHVAIFGGERGTELIERLLHEARSVLAPGGELAMELDEEEQAAPVAALARGLYPSAQVSVCQDAGGYDRVVRVTRHP